MRKKVKIEKYFYIKNKTKSVKLLAEWKMSKKCYLNVLKAQTLLFIILFADALTSMSLRNKLAKRYSPEFQTLYSLWHFYTWPRACRSIKISKNKNEKSNDLLQN